MQLVWVIAQVLHDDFVHLAVGNLFRQTIKVRFGDLPLSALEDPRVTRDFLEWRDEMAASPAKPTTPGPCS